MAFWNRRQPPATAVQLASVKEPYQPKPRIERVADWIITFDDGTTVTVNAGWMNTDDRYIVTRSGREGLVTGDLVFYTRTWNRFTLQSTSYTVARIRREDVRSVVSQNWTDVDFGVL